MFTLKVERVILGDLEAETATLSGLRYPLQASLNESRSLPGAAHTYDGGADDGRGQQGLEAVLQQQPGAVHQRPAPQVVVAAVPEADEAEGRGGGEQFVEGPAV